MKLVPIPFKFTTVSEKFWLPFLERVSRRAKEPISTFLDPILCGDDQVVVIWDEAARRAAGACGVRIKRHGAQRIIELVWLAGDGLAAWKHLMDDFEAYAKALGCNGVRMIGRPGWQPLLKAGGYRLTHITMQKDF